MDYKDAFDQGMACAKKEGFGPRGCVYFAAGYAFKASGMEEDQDAMLAMFPTEELLKLPGAPKPKPGDEPW